MQSKGQYIDGRWIQEEGKVFHSINPANGQLVWTGTAATRPVLNKAYAAAAYSLDHWSAQSFEARVDLVKQFIAQIEQHRDELAKLISLETGKPFWESQMEVSSVLAKLPLSIQSYQERSWPRKDKDNNTAIRYKPQGVVVVLGSFNFPAHISHGHIIPALLAGNTVLYKPSEYVPAVAEYMMQCWHEAGISPGVIQCLQGDARTGSQLLDLDIQGVYFTGSYPTGLLIHKQLSQRPEVLVALEMGGNNPLVLDEVDDLNAAVYASLLSTLLSTGQRCTCARRLIIPNSHQGEAFLNRLLQAVQALPIGCFDEQPQPFMGPVISHSQAQKHLQAQNKLIEQGGKPRLLMKPLQEGTGFLSPGLIDMTEVKNPPDIEIFAPLIQIYRYNLFEEAITLANQTRYGLVAALFSRHEAHYRQFYRQVRAGLISWNHPTTGALSQLPFGGVGLSGNHRPTAYFAADYCSYPVASIEQLQLAVPKTPLPGMVYDYE